MKHLNEKIFNNETIMDTRWECRLESVKAVETQLKDNNEALFEVGGTTKILTINSEAKSLAILVIIVLWICAVFNNIL